MLIRSGISVEQQFLLNGIYTPYRYSIYRLIYTNIHTYIHTYKNTYKRIQRQIVHIRIVTARMPHGQIQSCFEVVIWSVPFAAEFIPNRKRNDGATGDAIRYTLCHTNGVGCGTRIEPGLVPERILHSPSFMLSTL